VTNSTEATSYPNRSGFVGLSFLVLQ
jgi:hypothetical protein